MKSFALFFVFAQVAIFQNFAQFVRPAGLVPNILPAPIVAPSPCGCGSPIFPPVISGPPTVIAAPPSLISAPTSLIGPSSLVSPLSPVVIQPSSVANSLADTLSLLTVSSLLADSLPIGYPNVIGLPSYPPCGCGYNYYV